MPGYAEQQALDLMATDPRQPKYWKEPRGYAAIALVNPKCITNIGGAMRAAGCYGAKLGVLGGRRPQKLSHLSTDTQRAWKHIPHIIVKDVFDVLPYSCVPIAVDILPNAKSLFNFCHPERAFYVFGPEDGTLSREVVDRCVSKVYIPTRYCLNLSMCVNVVLYDRMMKED